MGANFVMLGRPYLFALGAEGACGLNALIRILGEDASLTLAQTGLKDVHDVSPAILENCPSDLILEPLTAVQTVTHQA